MNKSRVLFLGILFIVSCSDNDDSLNQACGVDDPIKELEWLKAEIDNREANITEDSKYCYITQADLNGQIVFIYQDCNPLINKIIPVYDCQGESMGTLHDDISSESLTQEMILWKTDDFACAVD